MSKMQNPFFTEGVILSNKLTVLCYCGRGIYLCPYEAFVMDVKKPDKIRPVDFDEPCNYVVVK